MVQTAVVIVSWNGKHLLDDCLNSLRLQSYYDFRIILVDNGSRDGTDQFIKEHYSDVEIIRLKENTGFAYANNKGISRALEDNNIKYIVTLNNDTKADENYLKELVLCAEKHPDAGAIQPKVINFFNKAMIDSVGILIYKDMSAINKGQKEKDSGQYEKEEEIFGASASAAMYLRDALINVALPSVPEGDPMKIFFDNSYFAYYEDVDLAWRLRLAGYKAYYTPKSKVYHVHSATGKNYSPFKAFHIHRNQYYNIIKNLPFWIMIRALIFMPIRYAYLAESVFKKHGAAAELSERVAQKQEAIASIVFRSWKDVLKNLGQLREKRKFIKGKKVVTNKEINKWLSIYRADFNKMIFG